MKFRHDFSLVQATENYRLYRCDDINGKIKKQTGNSVAVPVIEAVAREMIKALKEFSKTEEKTDGKSTEIEGFKAFNDTDFVPVECVS